MAITSGADAGALRILAQRFGQAATQLRSLDSNLTSQLSGTMAWHGPDSERFRQQWSCSLRTQLRAAAQLLDSGKAALLTNAEQQEQASSAPGASAAAAAASVAAAGAAAAVPLAAATGTQTCPVVDDSGLGPPVGGNPAQIAEWWKGLTQEQRADLLENNPGLIGNLDGVPAWARDVANRRLLEATITELEGRSRLAVGSEKEDLDRRLGHLYAIKRSLKQAGAESHLLLLDLSHADWPQVALAVGDVDTAGHVAIVTPGVGTNPRASLEHCTKEISDLKARSDGLLEQNGQGGKTATVIWMGYDIPQDWNVFNIAQTAPIREGGSSLAGFVEGIRASHESPVHITGLGHSLGSAVTGSAAQATNAFDSLVFFGSPGIMTNSTDSLHVPEGQVFVMEANGDPIARANYFSGDPSTMPGVTNLSTSGSDHGRAVTGHSGYLIDGSTSQYNMASVITGNPDGAVHGHTPDLADALRPFLGIRTEFRDR